MGCLWGLNMKNKSFGFTLSEIMIAIALIGTVAAMTIPTVGSSVQQRARLAEFRAAYSKAELALKSIIFEDGKIPQCYNNDPDKALYGLTNALAAGVVPEKSDGCTALTRDFTRAMGSVRSCKSNPKSEGCIPNNYLDGKHLKDCGNRFDVTNVESYILDNGMILFISKGNVGMKLFAIDVNGRKGPNKWGQDIFTFGVYESATSESGKSVYVTDLKILPHETCLPRSNTSAKDSKQMLKDSTNYK